MFSEKITLPVGILVGKTEFTEILLEEETFGHTLRATDLKGLDHSRMESDAYFSAAKMAVRITVPGLFQARMEHDEDFAELVEEYAEARGIKPALVTPAQVHPVSPEMIEALHPRDGRVLLAYNSILEARRSEFRNAATAVEDRPLGHAEDRLHGGGDTGEEHGRSERDTEGVHEAAGADHQ